MTTDTLTAQTEALDRALTTYQQGKGKLFDPTTGRPIYSAEQQQAREEALMGALDGVVQGAHQVADRAIEDGQRELQLLGADPSSRLSADELAQVNGQMELFREDF